MIAEYAAAKFNQARNVYAFAVLDWKEITDDNSQTIPRRVAVWRWFPAIVFEIKSAEIVGKDDLEAGLTC